MTSQISEARLGARPPSIARPSQARTGHPNLIPGRTWRLNASLGHPPMVQYSVNQESVRIAFASVFINALTAVVVYLFFKYGPNRWKRSDEAKTNTPAPSASRRTVVGISSVVIRAMAIGANLRRRSSLYRSSTVEKTFATSNSFDPTNSRMSPVERWVSL